MTIRGSFIRAGAGAALFGALFAATTVNAADLSNHISLKDGPANAPAADWAGFYAGAHLGYAWGDTGFSRYNTWYKLDLERGNFSTDGGIGGLQLGYNLQRDRLVLGVEVDLGGLGLDGSKQLDGWNGDHSFNYFVKYSLASGFYGDITGRLGYAADRSLFYVKGGAAFLRTNFEQNFYNDVINQSNQMLWGWTVGAGVEHMLSPNWSVKAEYQHFDFGEATFKLPYDNLKFAPAADAVTLGVNYHIHRDGEPLK